MKKNKMNRTPMHTDSKPTAPAPLLPRTLDRRNGLEYILTGDYYIPDIRLPEPKSKKPLGRWGRMYCTFLQKSHPILYSRMILDGTIQDVAAGIDDAAALRIEVLTRNLMKREGVSEGLKAHHPMIWTQRMNNIRQRVEEIVMSELICV